MRLALTVGDSGLGAALREQAALAGHEVLCFGRTLGLRPLAGVRDSSVELSQVANVRYVLASFRADAFVHLAWSANPEEHGDHRDRDGLDLAGKLFHTALDAGVPHVLGLGTCQEYGPRNGALREDGDCLPVSRHGLMRQVAHGLLSALAVDHDADYTWLRAFEVVGGHDGPLPCADPGRPTHLQVAPTTSDSARRDYFEVHDAARAILHAAEQRLLGPLNLCQGPVCTREELLRAIAVEARARGIAAHQFDLRHGAQWLGDPSRLLETGFVPRSRTAEQIACSILESYTPAGAIAA